VGIAAHRDTYFRALRKVRPADSIFLETLDGTYQPKDADVLAASDGAELTLVTCYPFYFVGSAPRRFIVRARRVGSASAKR